MISSQNIFSENSFIENNQFLKVIYEVKKENSI